MFLDDELLEMCKSANLDNETSIQQLNEDICKRCEVYYKEKLIILYENNGTNKEAKIIMDKTFNLFNSFVRMAKKDTNETISLIGNFFEKHSFKKQLFNNKEIERFYNKL